MKRNPLIYPGKAFLPGFFLFIISCSTSFKNDLDLGKTVATVNNYDISAEFFEEFYIRSVSRLGLPDNPKQRYIQLDELINLTLLKQHAVQMGLDDSITQTFRKLKEDRALNRKWIQQHVYQHIPEPNEAQKRTAFFRSLKDLYVRQLFFTNEQEAQWYYKRLQNGEDFIDLANELYGSQTVDSTAGFIGKVSYFDVDNQFAEKAWSLPINTFSEPFRTRQGYFIIRVENANYSPLITENQYQQKEKKIEFKVKERIFNLEADAFIKDFMQKTNPQVNQKNVEKVYSRLVQIPEYKNVGKVVHLPQIDLETSLKVAQDIQPNDPLLEYEFDGEKRIFTAGDYVRWLSELPLNEIKNRTVASIGRALRYQVAAEDARNHNMLSSTAVQFERDFITFFYITGRLQDSLKAAPVPNFSDDTLHYYYENFGFKELKGAFATYWLIPAHSFKEAKQILKEINDGKKKPNQYSGYSFFENKSISRESGVEAFMLNLQTPIRSVMNPADDEFYVFEFFKTEKEYKTFEETRKNVEDAVKSGYNEVQLLKELRKTASVKVDTAAFKELMQYYETIHISDKTLN